tara:strand:- start:1010 stop:1588 length:579 start_codon:yes stop_codon:yes gene_type:complete
VCVDANKAQRQKARERWLTKQANHQSRVIQWLNREPRAVRGRQRVATGFSRGISDDYQKALYNQGQGRRAYETGYIKYLQQKQTVDEGGRARRRSTGRQAILRAKGALENAARADFGEQMQRRYRGRLLQMQTQQAKVRNQLGIRPEYGAPVLMPPSDRLTGGLDIAAKVLGIGSIQVSDQTLFQEMGFFTQ